MTKYLVTGSAGFLGFALAQKLSENPENTVFMVDNFVRGERDEAYMALCNKENVTELAVDLTSPQDVDTLPKDIDYVLHMAALNGTQNFYERPFDVVKHCTLPTVFLAEFYGKIGKLQRFLYAGTSESYASTVSIFGWSVPTAEDVPLSFSDVFNPRWSYGASKMHGEVATINASAHFKMPITIVRFHNAYGPRMGDKHVIPDFYNRAKRGVFELYGYEDTRSFIYVDDAVRATLALATAQTSVNEVVNVGGADEITMEALGRKMMEVGGFEGEIALHPSPAGSVKRRAPDLTKLKRLIGYEPEWSLEQGLATTAKFYLAEN